MPDEENMPVVSVYVLNAIVPVVSVVVLVEPEAKLLNRVQVPPVPLNVNGQSNVLSLPVIVCVVVEANVVAAVPAV